jgi:hypothetical protein
VLDLTFVSEVMITRIITSARSVQGTTPATTTALFTLSYRSA